MPKPSYVLGTNLSHDGSACLLKDGQICVAIEKERITRRKHDGNNDTQAITYCLDAAGIEMSDIGLIVQNTWEGMFERGNTWFRGPRILPPEIPVVTISHHLAHAYSAFATSPFRETAVMVIDNGGNSLDECLDLEGAVIPVTAPAELRPIYSETDSFYELLPNGELKTLYKDFSPPALIRKPYPMLPRPMMHSIGGVYMAVSMYVFSGMEDPGKLMGLAPFGRPGVYDMPIFDLHDGRVFVRYDWPQYFNDPCRNYEHFKQRFQYYADIAYWTQKEVERAILYLIENRRALSSSTNLCYVGGVALNAVANRRLLTDGLYENIYIQPAAGDNGIAIGCAYYGWLEVMKRERVMHSSRSIFLGRSYSTEVIDSMLEKRDGPYLVLRSDDYIRSTAQLLADGKIVAWFQGGSEFGPRALGNRSILADARRPEMRDMINRYIKDREDFRPFAPSVLREEASVYFECDYESPYMILVAPVRPQFRGLIPSVVHEDCSARVQTVTEEFNPAYYRLLQECKKLTGIGLLLNTSLNKRGQPIIETPEQAWTLFVETAIDALMIEGRLVCKSGV